MMKRSIGLATAAGFLVGAVWVALAFVFFTAPQSSTVDAITCPPFLVTDWFAAPVLNAILYGTVALIWSWISARLRSRANKRIGPAVYTRSVIEAFLCPSC